MNTGQEPTLRFCWPHFWDEAKNPDQARGAYRCRACGEETDTPTLFDCPGQHSSRPGWRLTLLEQRREEAWREARARR